MRRILLVFSFLFVLILSACNVPSFVNQVTVTYEVSGGTEIASTSYLPGKEITLPTPERDGYTFGGWFLEATLETEIEDNYVIEEDITFYAKWIGTHYTITYQTNGGLEIEPEEYERNQDLILPIPTRSGYLFIGWTENQETEEIFDETKMPERDIVLYALWQLYTATTTHVIGYIGPLTGSDTTVANDILNGVTLAVDEINMNGGINGAYLSVEYRDSENVSSVTVDAYNDLMARGDVVAIICGGDEAEVQLITSYAEVDNIAVIAPAVTDDLTDEVEILFQPALTEDQQLSMGIGYVIDLNGAEHPAILYNEDSEVSTEMYFKYRVILINQGVFFETFSIGDDDEDWQLEVIINSFDFRGCDLWISPAAQGYFSTFMDMAINMGVNSPFVHLDSWNYDEQEGDGIMLKEFSPYDDKAEVAAFKEMYQLQYSEVPGLHSALGYDSVQIIASAIENTTNVTPSGLVQAIKNVEITTSVTGFIGFNEEGTAMKEIAIIEVVDGSPVVTDRYREEIE